MEHSEKVTWLIRNMIADKKKMCCDCRQHVISSESFDKLFSEHVQRAYEDSELFQCNMQQRLSTGDTDENSSTESLVDDFCTVLSLDTKHLLKRYDKQRRRALNFDDDEIVGQRVTHSCANEKFVYNYCRKHCPIKHHMGDTNCWYSKCHDGHETCINYQYQYTASQRKHLPSCHATGDADCLLVKGHKHNSKRSQKQSRKLNQQLQSPGHSSRDKLHRESIAHVNYTSKPKKVNFTPRPAIKLISPSRHVSRKKRYEEQQATASSCPDKQTCSPCPNGAHQRQKEAKPQRQRSEKRKVTEQKKIAETKPEPKQQSSASGEPKLKVVNQARKEYVHGLIDEIKKRMKESSGRVRESEVELMREFELLPSKLVEIYKSQSQKQ